MEADRTGYLLTVLLKLASEMLSGFTRGGLGLPLTCLEYGEYVAFLEPKSSKSSKSSKWLLYIFFAKKIALVLFVYKII